ncbi:outer membrane beta-barrel protein [Vibrio nomapromontoriensis]|uniref:outer membrane beta-barrel protein n=1 Tax=Vibrio nomapromontoriensis TaxID=2910246 RepID=UPI003D09CEDE
MKKLIVFLTWLTGTVVTDTVAANEYSDWRIGGGGTSGVGVENYENDFKTSKFEIGYDLNRVFSLNLSYQNISRSATNGVEKYQVNMKRTDLEFEGGYAIPAFTFDIKPYLGIGITDIKGKVTLNNKLMNGRDNSVTTFVGVRVNTPYGVYIDGRYGNGRVVHAMNSEHYTATIGFKF